MTLRLTNTLTRRKEIFSPILQGHISIYCCGVTVYDLCHIGHARSYIAWDILRRYLIWKGNEVTFIQNFTDIDDKILLRAKEEGCTMNEISERNIREFHKDMDALGILRPDRMPRATKSLDAIRSMIGTLEAKGAAYSTDGDVYFAVMKHNSYGKLSRRDLSEQQLNADGRITDKQEARKKNPFDFALWKGAKEGEPSFPSKWGTGRPGWHIECSAMVKEELGDTIDIHLGGADLVFPHHENEIAQSEIANGRELARFWLHNGMVNVGGQKMSKSLGNFTTIRALLEEGLSAMTLRFFVLQAHYRKPLDFTKESLSAASVGWKGLNSALSLGNLYADQLNWKVERSLNLEVTKPLEIAPEGDLKLVVQRFIDCLDDDLNTSGALAVLFELARPLRAFANQLQRGDVESISQEEKKFFFLPWQLLVNLSGALGLKAELNSMSSLIKDDLINDNEIRSAIEERKTAKLARDFDKADQIRDRLRELGVEVVDKSGGETDWIRH